MRILLLTTYFRPDLCSTGVIMTKLAEEFVARGNQVTVVTSVPHYDKNEIWPEYSKKLMYVERRDGMTVYRLRTYIPKDKSSIPQRLLGYATFHLLSFLRTVTLPAHDVILVPSPPLSNGVIADLVSRLRGTPFVYNVQDIWPDVAVRAGVLTNPRALRFLQRMERYVYSRATKIAVISEGFRRQLLRKGVPPDKVSVISNFIDTDFVSPITKPNEFTSRQGLDSKFVVLFAGNMGFSQGLDVVVDCAQLLQHQADIQFLLVGNGASKSQTEDRCRSLNLKNVHFLPYQPHEDVPAMYGAADVCLIPLKRGFTMESVPCKVFTIMAAGKPSIAAVDKESDTAKLIASANCGVCVNPEDASALAQAICHYRDHQNEAIAAGESGRRFVENNFHASGIADSYLHTLEATLPQQSRLAPKEAVPSSSDFG